jgi:putative salt-induced outer membrane protein YdiY
LEAGAARAQAELTGAPPADAKALVDAPKGPGDAPVIVKPTSSTSATVSAGGQLATGNSRQLAATANGLFETRFGDNSFGAAILGNYGEGAAPGASLVETAKNIQGRLRYDRYLTERASLFFAVTGRQDKFQGLYFRLNLDPGFKYLFINCPKTTLWGELGYDFQYDDRYNSARYVLDANGDRVVDNFGNWEWVPKTEVDHSVRAFVGAKHAFNEQVNIAGGVEYLQSVVDSKRSRLNFDLLFVAKVGAGASVGLGFSARYDNDPLPGKQNLDTATTVSLLYSFSPAAAPPPPPPPPPPCVPTPPEPPPAAAPAPAPAAPPAPATTPAAPAPAAQPPTASPAPSTPAPSPAPVP